MLHKSAYSLLFNQIKIGNRLSSHCLKWNDDNTIVVVTKSKKTLFMWKFGLVILFAYAFFIYYRIYESLSYYNLPAEQCCIQFFYGISFFYYSTNSFNCYAKGPEIAEFVTNFFNFDRKFQPMDNQIGRTKAFGKVLIMFWMVGIGSGFFQGPCFLYFQKNHNFIFSVVEPRLEPATASWVVFIFALFEMWLSLMSWFTSLFHSFIFIAVANCIPLWTEHMTFKGKGKPNRPMSRRTYYRSLQCLMVQFNDCYSWHSFMGVKISAFIGLIISCYGSLRFYGKIPILGYAVMPLSIVLGTMYAFLMFPKAAEARSCLVEMLNGWGLLGINFLTGIGQAYGLGGPIAPTSATPTAINTDGTRRNNEGDKNNNSQQDQNVLVDIDDPAGLVPVSNTFVPPPRVISNQRLGRQIRFSKKRHNLSFIRSCSQVGFRIGDFYIIHTGTTFTFIDLVVNQTINCLLSFN